MMIKVDNLCKIYSYKKKREKIAVDKISFQIDDGEIVGFLGPNGAGKTTTLKMLSGIMFPTDGQAEVSGYVPWEGNNEFKRNISIVLGQKNQLWWDLPANESLYLNKCIYDISDKDYNKTLDELSELLEVKELLDVQVRNLSLGERMKMELLAALLHKPKVIFLDEPTIGLDLIAQKKIRDFLKYYNMQEKITIMLTSHYLEDIKALCQRTIVINNGSLVYDGKIESMSEGDIPLEESLELLYRTR
jgi:ABC-2 type transport system ATP-binding protein